jgi:hypothetical protein
MTVQIAENILKIALVEMKSTSIFFQREVTLTGFHNNHKQIKWWHYNKCKMGLPDIFLKADNTFQNWFNLV